MNDGFERSIEQFEREFISGKSPQIENFVSENGEDSLLSELVHTEMELRLSAGEGARVENYTRRFPQLENNEQMIQDLVLTEYKVRRNFDPACRLEEYLLRFPNLRKVLVDNFLESSVVGEFCSTSYKIKPDTTSDIAARFRKKNLFAQGGLGNVWLARDGELNREVAVKEIKSKFANSAPHRIRFERETKITGKLEHPGIVPVYGKGQSGNGAPFFAMQMVRGDNLKSRIARLHNETVNREVRQSKRFNRLIQHFVDVCHTVEFAHSQGVIHRDIKPENIMIGRYGETFLIDWGLACVDDGADRKREMEPNFEGQNPEASRAGQTIGSPAFMSPEQACGEHAVATRQSDIYSLGATLLSLIANTNNPNNLLAEAPYRMQTLRKSLSRELGPLLSICDRAMSHSPEQRYPSVQQLREDVENFLIDKRVIAHQESLSDSWSRFSRRNRRVINTALISLMLISLLSVVAAVWINTERNEAIEARLSEMDLRKQAERMQNAEKEARNRAEHRTSQLTRVIGIFADALTGSDDAGLNNNPNELTAASIIEQLRDKLNENDDPIVQALLKAIVARGRRAAGNYGDAIRYYEETIELLNREGISNTDPLRADVMTGLCAAKMATGKLSEAGQLADRVVEICDQAPDDLKLNYFRILLVQAQLATRMNQYDGALKLALEASNCGSEIFASSSHANLVWAKYVLAGIHRRLGELDEATVLFGQIFEDEDFTKQRHPLSIAAAVQLSELRYFEDPLQAIEVMNNAVQQAELVHGKNHPDTFRVRARYGRMLAQGSDVKQKDRGIELLADCRERQSQLFGPTSDDVLGTTLLLANSLVESNDADAALQAVDFLQDTIRVLQEATQTSDRSTAFKAAFFSKLAVAFEILDQNDQALQAIEHAVDWAIQAYGEDSSATKKLINQRDQLRNQE